jgi:lipopolysaccharide transport system ATP-binding protein
MSDVVIKVNNLSKQYRIGAKEGYKTFRETLVDAAKAPFKGISKLLTQNSKLKTQNSKDLIWALKDVSFEVKRGEVVGIIGRNGAGKSTLLKILSKITEPTEGRIEMRGRVGSLLEVGTGFHPELSGHENIYLYGAILGMDRWEISRKFDEIVAFAELEKFIDTPVKRYSSGMYMRLAFAVAAHLEPEILIVDEVLAVGDAAFQKKCLGKMGDVSKEGRTVLFVSHNMGAVQNLCSRSILLDNGQIFSDSSTQKVVEIYLRSIHEQSILNLSERTDRNGSGDIRFTKIIFLDKDAAPIDHAVSGQRLTIRLYYKSNSATIHKNCRVSVSLHRQETTFFIASTELVSNREIVLFEEGYLDCIIENFPFSQGEYFLNPFVESNGIVQDWIESATQLSVIDGDFYGTGRNYPPGWEGKTVLVRHRWEW